MVLSGDCTTWLGTVAGLQRAGLDPGIAWFDAHGDVQTLETTTSGYLGGLPLRQLTGYRPGLIADGLGLRPVPEHPIERQAPGTSILPRSPTWPARPSAGLRWRTSPPPGCRTARCTCTSTST